MPDHSQYFFLHGAREDLGAAARRLIKVLVKVKVIHTVCHNLCILLPLPLFTPYQQFVKTSPGSMTPTQNARPGLSTMHSNRHNQSITTHTENAGGGGGGGGRHNFPPKPNISFHYTDYRDAVTSTIWEWSLKSVREGTETKFFVFTFSILTKPVSLKQILYYACV